MRQHSRKNGGEDTLDLERQLARLRGHTLILA
jgi:hypothetical protein